MSEEDTPGQQDPSPGQQDPAPPESTEKGEDWERRYKGSVSKIEELTLKNRDLQAQLENLTSNVEQQKSQLSVKDVERDVAVAERDKEIKSLVEAKAQADKELVELKALKMKIDAAKELGHPELIEIADRIPSVDDPEVMKEVMKDFWGFAEKQVKKREEQLLAGETPPSGSGLGGDTAPSTKQAWLDRIESFTLGTPERTKAMNDYGDWLQQQNQ